jgi:hypothetical protein
MGLQGPNPFDVYVPRSIPQAAKSDNEGVLEDAALYARLALHLQ